MKFFKITELIITNTLKRSKCIQINFIFLSRTTNFSTSLYHLEKITENSIAEHKDTVKENVNLPPAVPEKDKEVVENLKKGDILYPFKTPSERFYSIMKKDFKVSLKNIIHTFTGIKVWQDVKPNYFPRHTDILVIGSGLVGISVAYALKYEYLYCNDIILLDKNPNAPYDTINLGCGSITHQNFVYDEEIEMSKYCTEFLSSFQNHTMMIMKDEGFRVPYEPLGSLVLADDTNADSILEKCKILDYRGIPVRLMNGDNLTKKFPWLNVDGIKFGSWGPLNEGLIDPWAVATGMKAKLINMGVKFVTAEAIDFGSVNNSSTFRRIVCRLPDGTYNSIDFSRCVIAAGMGSGKLVDAINAVETTFLKVRIPEEERKRYEYCFYNTEGPGLNTPIITNPDGVYFRREGLSNLYVAGVMSVSSDEPEGRIYQIFEDKIKPFLMKTLNFKELKLKSGWIDSYTCNKANELGVIGYHPCNPEILFAVGFTNRGWLFAPAVGRAIMELIYYGDYQTIDMTRFQPENLWLRQHLEVENKKKKLLESEMRKALSDSA